MLEKPFAIRNNVTKAYANIPGNEEESWKIPILCLSKKPGSIYFASYCLKD